MVMPLKVAFVEWPEGLATEDPRWVKLKESVTALRPDMLVTNELPFGPWLAEDAVFSEDEAQLSFRAHAKGLTGLIDLDPVITHRVAFEQFEKGLAAMASGEAGKVILMME